MVLDLDNTLLECTPDKRLALAFEHKPPYQHMKRTPTSKWNPDDVSTGFVVPDIYRFKLKSEKNTIHYVKLRYVTHTHTRTSIVHSLNTCLMHDSPHVEEFLKQAAEMYELHVYTNGTKEYAKNIAQILDPEHRYFHDRVVARNEKDSTSLIACSLAP